MHLVVDERGAAKVQPNGSRCHEVGAEDGEAQTIETLGELSEESIAPSTRAELLEAFRSWRKR